MQVNLRTNAAYGIVPLAMLGLFAAYPRKWAPAPAAADCGCSAESIAQANPPSKMPADSPPRAHDPSMAKEGKTYYVFTTGPGIAVQTSTDRIHWKPAPRVFTPIPSWTRETITGSNEFYWAPDISYFNHKWHLYYAVSTFGKNRSAIGLATNVTLDSTRPDFKWVDEGPVVQSYPKDNYNAIDPVLALDEHKQPWLAFGSFWGGIQIVRLDEATGKPTEKDLVAPIASRPHTEGQPGAIEAPYIIRHGRDFYLFSSFDFCCRGIRSTYNIRVGRAKSINGPYLDRDGKSMLDGGGTQILASAGRWYGPGGNSVFREGRTDYLVYHAYDGEDNGAPKLRIDALTWDKDGWPHAPGGP